jgi:hypothetical protein
MSKLSKPEPPINGHDYLESVNLDPNADVETGRFVPEKNAEAFLAQKQRETEQQLAEALRVKQEHQNEDVHAGFQPLPDAPKQSGKLVLDETGLHSTL